MSNENKGMEQVQPFHKPQNHLNAGTVSIEQSRAVAEALGKIQVAKQFPRSASSAFQQVMDSCKRLSLARAAIYAYPRAGQTISGPSIRLAEELARAVGNIEFGIRELSQREGESEMQSFAWDLETNVISVKTFTVKHERHTKTGVTKLVDPRDIYELTANQGGRRLRACILAVIPPDLVEEALEQCKKTLAGDTSKPLADRIKAMISSFAPYGVTTAHIEQKMGVKVDSLMVDQLTDLVSIYNSLKDGMSKPSDWFNVAAVQASASTAESEHLAKLSKAAPAATATPAKEKKKSASAAAAPAPATEAQAAEPAAEEPAAENQLF